MPPAVSGIDQPLRDASSMRRRQGKEERRETNCWKWPALQFCDMSVLAYLAALATNQAIMAFVR
ncbi:MAG: hypothetical protein WBW84_23060 [Acidobacteriaceae bacterium]